MVRQFKKSLQTSHYLSIISVSLYPFTLCLYEASAIQTSDSSAFHVQLLGSYPKTILVNDRKTRHKESSDFKHFSEPQSWDLH